MSRRDDAPLYPMRALLVDDEPCLESLLQIALHRAGWALVGCPSAEAALEAWRGADFDVMIVDKNLPGMSGAELIRRVRQVDGDVEIVAITACASVAAAEELMPLGIAALLDKPFDDLRQVVRLLDGLAARRRAKLAVGAPTAHRPRAAPDAGEPTRPDLVVSPDAQTRRCLCEYLQAAGEHVCERASLDEALCTRPQGSPCLCVLQASVRLDEEVRALRAAWPATEVVVVADAPTLSLARELITLGVHGLIERPLEPGRVRAQLAAVLARARSGGGARLRV